MKYLFSFVLFVSTVAAVSVNFAGEANKIAVGAVTEKQGVWGRIVVNSPVTEELAKHHYSSGSPWYPYLNEDIEVRKTVDHRLGRSGTFFDLEGNSDTDNRGGWDNLEEV